ncbi:hypothetical protein [Capnocytophaga gingivalis]|uniref:hypothetical protein n=1 Tax=Capnocytophaga gingivalis TaxID=1017 RepID=UPI0028D558F7|nr:hypothetical protein [Capnocytophaga gingivalis]
MKHLLFTAFLLLGTFNYAQTKVIVPHPETGREMFYFSEGLYKDYEIIGNYASNRIDKKLKKGDKTVEILEHIHGIQVSEYDSHTHIKYVFAYNKETKSLMAQRTYFYSIDTGVWKEYDTNGNVIKEEDMDAYYKITINDFVNLMKEQYKIDLFSNNYVWSIDRYKDNRPRPIYVVIEGPSRFYSRYITIDANTGETLFDKCLSGDFSYVYEEQIYAPK